MKILNALIVFLLNPNHVKFGSDNTIKLYERSILYHAASIKTNKLHILRCESLELPTKIGRYTIAQDDDAVRLVKGNKSLYVMKILPIQVADGNIIICVMDFTLNTSSGNPALSYSGNEVFTYKYNETTKQYILLKRVVDGL